MNGNSLKRGGHKRVITRYDFAAARRAPATAKHNPREESKTGPSDDYVVSSNEASMGIPEPLSKE